MDSSVINPSFSSFSFNLYPFPRTSSFNCHSVSVIRLQNFKNLKTSSVSCSYNPHSNPRKPNSRCRKYGLIITPFSLFVPILQSIRVFAAKTSKRKWVCVSRGRIDSETLPEDFNGTVLQNGAFGMSLLSATSTTKARISPFVSTLATNPTFVSGLFAWVIAQSMKVFLNFCVERKWDLRIMFASGGMPSSHSALCTALTTSVAICHGVADSLFPVCLGFSLIVMYDAIGVRRHAGMQAEVLNLIVEDLFQGHPISQRKLKELLGHTPSQVLVGALLGIVVACVCCQGGLVAV